MDMKYNRLKKSQAVY